jgi:hypothetical protein
MRCAGAKFWGVDEAMNFNWSIAFEVRRAPFFVVSADSIRLAAFFRDHQH